MKKPSEKNLTMIQAAKKLGCSRQNIHKAIVRGSLKAEKIHFVSWHWEIDESELRRFKNENSFDIVTRLLISLSHAC